MKYIVVLITILFTFAANANLLISPTRISYDNRDRVHEVILINTTTEARTYRVSWSEKKIGADGRYEELAEGDKAVSKLSPYVRFSPRQVRLESGERQTIKLQLRKQANMNDSEYRSHLLFTAMPLESKTDSDDEITDGMRMQLNMLVSYSIPVLYHPKKPNVKITIEGQNLVPRNDNGADLNVRMSRSGDNSAFGRIEIYASVDGVDKRIGLANNISVFREVSVKEQAVRIPNFKDYEQIENVRIKYVGEKEYAGQTLAERVVSF